MKALALFLHCLALAAHLIFCPASLAQDAPGGNIIWDLPAVYQALPLSMPPHDMSPRNDTFVSYRHFVPVVEQSCATCGAVNLMLATLMSDFFKKGIPGKPALAKVNLSYEFLFTVAKGDCGKGIKMSRLIDTLLFAGIAQRQHYHWESNCWLGIQQQPLPTARQAALSFKPPIVKRLWDTTATDWQKIDAGIAHLCREMLPVICFAAKPPVCETEKYWKPTPLSSRDEPGHAMLLVAFQHPPGNPMNGFFVLANSYGKDCHDQGFVKMSYADFGKYARCAYVVGNVNWNMGTDEDCPIFYWEGLRGAAEILGKRKGEPAFQPVLVQPDDARQGWKTNPLRWEAGTDSFQLKLNIRAGICTSVFAVKPGEAAQLWWQTDEHVPADTSVLLPFSFAVQEGVTHLVVLFSLYPFDDLESRLANLQAGGNCRAQLEGAFGCWLLPAGACRREDYSMAFLPPLQAMGNGMAVPLILRLEGRR